MNDVFYMEQALNEAKKAFTLGEVPIGAIVVYQGNILSRAHNQTESLTDPTAHAETLAVKEASQKLSAWRLTGCTLYSTLEPCSMCAGALLLARIDRLVYGAPDIRHGAHGSFVDLFEPAHPTHTLSITTGILKEECATLMKEFFQQRRYEKSTQ